MLPVVNGLCVCGLVFFRWLQKNTKNVLWKKKEFEGLKDLLVFL
jgi:hypothetical protein